jgi:hypothetical protein
MKRILCHLAQRRPDPGASPTGWLAKHLDSCPECRDFRDRVRTLEPQLRSDPPPCDDAFCDALMTRIEASRTGDVATPKPLPAFALRPWLLGASGLAAAAALVIAVVTFTNPEDAPQAETPPVAVPDETPLPDPEVAVQTLAHLLEQQELLQRDARKLGAHLRERVILFRPVD